MLDIAVYHLLVSCKISGLGRTVEMIIIYFTYFLRRGEATLCKTKIIVFCMRIDIRSKVVFNSDFL
jgi:hypothetical protein